jgi:SAM-dependent methyltransferase
MSDADRIAAQAARFGVSAAIHPEDHIWNFVLGHPGFGSRAAAIEYYFADGAASADRFAAMLEAASPGAALPGGASPGAALPGAPTFGAPTPHSATPQATTSAAAKPGPPKPGPATPHVVLDFAAGYGCVTRHLARNPALTVTACDIHAEAVTFLRHEIGVRALGSAACPEELSLPRLYDAVLALSFFSHMPLATWARWLVRLSLPLHTGGLLVFTTHGLRSRAHFGDPTLPEPGFWFRPDSEQPDLPAHAYGQTITAPAFVRDVIASIPWVELVSWQEGAWWGHQDAWVLRKRLHLPDQADPRPR